MAHPKVTKPTYQHLQTSLMTITAEILFVLFVEKTKCFMLNEVNSLMVDSYLLDRHDNGITSANMCKKNVKLFL